MQEIIVPYITLIIQLSIVITMVSVGMQVTGEQILAAVSRVGLTIKALLANLIIMPLVAFFLAWALDVPQGFALGFLLVAAAPGAPMIPKLAEVARANLPFAVGLMVILAFLAIVTTPVTASIILPLDDSIQFNVPAVIRSLVIFQLIPLLTGLGIRRWLPGVQKRIVRPSIWLANISVASAILLVAWRDFETLLALPWTVIAAALLFVAIALLTGWFFGGPDTPTRKSLALGTSAQSNGLALLIASTNLPGTGAGIAIVAFGLLNLVINFAIAIFWGRKQ